MDKEIELYYIKIKFDESLWLNIENLNTIFEK